MKNSNIYNLTLIALGAAIIAVFSPLAIPIGLVPITLQTLAVGLVASVFKARETLFAVLVYLFLGLVGLPVFSAGTSGFAVLFGPSGGFLFAFIPVGLLISWLSRRAGNSFAKRLLGNLLCYALLLLLGTIWFKFYLHSPWLTAIKGAFLPFLLVELAKAVAVSMIGRLLLPALARVNPYFTKD